MHDRRELFVFFIAEQRYAIDLACVERVVRACAVTPLADAPRAIMGVAIIHGQVLPVFDPRVRFGLPLTPLDPSHEFAVSQTGRRTVCLLIDNAVGIVNCTPADRFKADELVAGAPSWLSSVQKTHDGVIYIHDLETFLSAHEEEQLSAALQKHEESKS